MKAKIRIARLLQYLLFFIPVKNPDYVFMRITARAMCATQVFLWSRFG